eukprot:COSAG05_NODE_20_length_33177_cov_336.302639_14_plen_78_part_00
MADGHDQEVEVAAGGAIDTPKADAQGTELHRGHAESSGVDVRAIVRVQDEDADLAPFVGTRRQTPEDAATKTTPNKH